MIGATFFFGTATISAQKNNNTISDKEFRQLLDKDEAKAFGLAEQKKLSTAQLKLFIEHRYSKNDGCVYVTELQDYYWQQLGDKDKLIYENMLFLKSYSCSIRWAGLALIDTSVAYQPNKVFAYFIARQAEYKKAWGDSLFNNFVLMNLELPCDELNLLVSKETIFGNYLEETMDVAGRERQAEKYFQFVRQNLPTYEMQARAYVNSQCIYQQETETAKYYFWLNEFFMLNPIRPEYLHFCAADIANNSNLDYKPLGLAWINKALKSAPKPEYHICKAELLYQMGKIDEAKDALDEATQTVHYDNHLLGIYYRRVEQLIKSKK